MIIYIRYLTGKTLTLEVESSDTIESVIARIPKKVGNDTYSKMRLLWGGKPLMEGRTLSDFNVIKESTLNVVGNLEPRQPASETTKESVGATNKEGDETRGRPHSRSPSSLGSMDGISRRWSPSRSRSGNRSQLRMAGEPTWALDEPASNTMIRESKIETRSIGIQKAGTGATARPRPNREELERQESARYAELEGKARYWKEKALQYDFDDDLYIVDPETHIGLLSALEKRIQRESQYMRRGGDYTALLRFDPDSCRGHVPASVAQYMEHEKLRGFHTNLLESYLVLNRVIGHLDDLIRHGFATDYFSIIVERPQGNPATAEVVPIHRHSLVVLADVLADRIQSLSQENVVDDQSLFERLTVALELATRGLGENTIRQIIKHRRPGDWDFRWLAWILELGLISYVGSHASRFDLGLGHQTGRIMVPIPRPGIFLPFAIEFSLRSMSCLSGFLDSEKVWVLAKTIRSESSPITVPRPMSILTTMPHFADIWGPIYAVRDPASDKVLQYNTAKGVIRNTGVTAPTVVSEVSGMTAIHCHWEPAPKSFMGRCRKGVRRMFKPPSMLLDDSDTLLIGQELTENESCPYTLDAFQRDFRAELSTPGTHPASWEIDGLAASISLPRYFNFSISGTKKKIPATTLKQLIRDKWMSSPARANPWLLHQSLGVEVSHCTGNARRVPLKQLLMHPAVQDYLDVQLPSWSTSGWGLQLQQAFANQDPEEVLRFWRSQYDMRGRVGELVVSLLELLDDTGSDMRAFRVVSLINNMEHLLRMSLRTNSWATILQDTDTRAAYALMTNCCLEHACAPTGLNAGSRCSRASPGAEKLSFTCLQTRLSPGDEGAALGIAGDPDRLRYCWEGDTLVPRSNQIRPVPRMFRRRDWRSTPPSPVPGDRLEVVDDVDGRVPLVQLRARRQGFGGMSTPRAGMEQNRPGKSMPPGAAVGGANGPPSLAPTNTNAVHVGPGAHQGIDWSQAWSFQTVARQPNYRDHALPLVEQVYGNQTQAQVAAATAATPASTVAAPTGALRLFEVRPDSTSRPPGEVVVSIAIAKEGTFGPSGEVGRGAGLLRGQHVPVSVVPRRSM